MADALHEVVRASTARAWLYGDPRRVVAGALVLTHDALEFRVGPRTLRVPLDAMTEIATHAPFAGNFRISWRIVRVDVEMVWHVDEVDEWLAAIQGARSAHSTDRSSAIASNGSARTC